MSRTHKDRHKWKNKERKRTGKSDPKKIKTHRERFLQRVEEREKITTCYSSIVFRVRLIFNPDGQTTELKLDNETVELFPFLVEDTETCHWRILAEKSDFNISVEQERLAKHVKRSRHFGDPCSLEQKSCGIRACSSVIPCKFRNWNSDRGLPECTK